MFIIREGADGIGIETDQRGTRLFYGTGFGSTEPDGVITTIALSHEEARRLGAALTETTTIATEAWAQVTIEKEEL